MKLSSYFLPTLREVPADAQIASHRLMLRAGMIRQTAAGVYAWLPLGLLVLRKIEAIVREEQNRAGALEFLMPTIQSADLWKQSGRYDDYGKEMLRIRDRHDREMLYGPTNEEMITAILRDEVRSYRDLPKMLYHIQWKFRDEMRPRFGVMRGREFLMKDAYSFDVDETAGQVSYDKMFVAYLRSFARLGLRAIPMRAETGPIGGNLSHEFVILADTGESRLWCDRSLLAMDPLDIDPGSDAERRALIQQWTSPYAATDEQHDAQRYMDVAEHHRYEGRGIEVGHVFFFGTKYSEALGASVQDQNGQDQFVQMGSYGIGVSRLVGAIIEASHDDAGIIWPDVVAPFDIGLINLRAEDAACQQAADSVVDLLERAGHTILYDDRAERAGAKFADLELIGLPWRIVVSPRNVKSGIVDVKRRDSGEQVDIAIDDLPAFLTKRMG